MKYFQRRKLLKFFFIFVIFGGIVGQAVYILIKFFLPKANYGPPQRIKIGAPHKFSDGPNFLSEHQIFVIKEGNKFHAISSVCTHLGCNVTVKKLTGPKTVTVRGKEIEEKWEFHCPCHGSSFYGDGTPYTGPAPSPLPAFKLSVSTVERKLVVDKGSEVSADWRLTV
jgi:menaquinol-cytochrome c reductase iron-sulfur subunit